MNKHSESKFNINIDEVKGFKIDGSEHQMNESAFSDWEKNKWSNNDFFLFFFCSPKEEQNHTSVVVEVLIKNLDTFRIFLSGYLISIAQDNVHLLQFLIGWIVL